MQSVPRIEFEAQGRLVKLKVRMPKMTQFPSKKHHRGAVTLFSDKSRKRLLEMAARLDLVAASLGKPIVFMTLTYGQLWPAETKEAKGHLRALFERIRRFAPEASAIWRIEYQKRGAPHFHIIIFKMPFLPKAELKRWWGQIVGTKYWDLKGNKEKSWLSSPAIPPFTRIEAIKSGRRAMSYVCKYVAKLPEPAAAGFDEDAGEGGNEVASGFNTMPYLHAGRWWGVFNADFLPYAEIVKMSFLMESSAEKKVFFDLRRLMAAKFAWVRRRQMYKGATLFVDSSDKWIDYWLHLLLEYTA